MIRPTTWSNCNNPGDRSPLSPFFLSYEPLVVHGGDEKQAPFYFNQGEVMLQAFKAAGIKLIYCPNSMCREIPTVDDVLDALLRTEHQPYYDFSLANHSPHIANIHLVIAAVAEKVLALRPYDEARARAIIAEAIEGLAPEGALSSSIPWRL